MELGIKLIFTFENLWLKQNAVKEDNWMNLSEQDIFMI